MENIGIHFLGQSHWVVQERITYLEEFKVKIHNNIDFPRVGRSDIYREVCNKFLRAITVGDFGAIDQNRKCQGQNSHYLSGHTFIAVDMTYVE